MPQLDRTIVFTQIFWLFFTFLFLYIILTHFFFPKFLESLKTRNLVAEHNNKESLDIKLNFLSNQTLLNQTLQDQLGIVKVILLHSFSLRTNKSLVNLDLVDSLIFNSIFYIALYCDDKILYKIPLNSKICNFGYKDSISKHQL